MRDAIRIHRAELLWLRLALAGALCIGAYRPGAAQESQDILAAAGPWEISQRDTPRKCGLILRANPAEIAGHAIILPAGCRRALPAIKEVGGWTMTPGRELILTDHTGQTVLSFSATADNLLEATGAAGETYELTPTGKQTFAQGKPPSGGLQPVPPAGAPAATPPGHAPAKPAPTPAADTPATTSPVARFNGAVTQLGGRYFILRAGAEGGKDVGCMLTLDEKSRGPGGFKAQLAPACRDNGIVIFEPVGWHFDKGRLVLTARKGHSAAFDYHADGSWWKDPKTGGMPLGLRHM